MENKSYRCDKDKCCDVFWLMSTSNLPQVIVLNLNIYIYRNVSEKNSKEFMILNILPQVIP